MNPYLHDPLGRHTLAAFGRQTHRCAGDEKIRVALPAAYRRSARASALRRSIGSVAHALREALRRGTPVPAGAMPGETSSTASRCG